MRRSLIVAMVVGCLSWSVVQANGPVESVVEAEHVLGELMAIPAKQIPHRLLEEAQGIVIVPNVVKIGFVAGARRGHGIVMVRDTEGEWSLPQFLTLTGGSVGFQAGVQSTDVVLVFTTRQGIEGLMRGRFTIGVDAAATAGPVGREAAAGTDLTLQSEIYSYSRSRGLFAGVALDGSSLDIDHEAHAFYYGSPTGQVPHRVPAPAADLRHFVTELSARPGAAPATGLPGAPAQPDAPVPMSPRLMEGLRRSLVQSNAQLQSIISPEWRQFLALPIGITEPGKAMSPEALKPALGRFAQVSKSPEYHQLSQRPEFQHTYELLQEYERALTTRPALQLPPPPTAKRAVVEPF